MQLENTIYVNITCHNLVMIYKNSFNNDCVPIVLFLFESFEKWWGESRIENFSRARDMYPHMKSALVSMKTYEYLKKFTIDHNIPWSRWNATEMEKFLVQEK